VNTRLFWRAAAVQGALVGVLFLVLALTLSDDFFEDYGIVAGPVAWVACSLVSARILGLPVAFALFCAAAGAVAGTLVGLVASHPVGLAVGIAVFAASAAGYERPAADGGEGLAR
jgi:hypothetical protein